MRLAGFARAALFVASLVASVGALAYGTPINLSSAPPTLTMNVNGTAITIGDSSSASEAARVINTARASAAAADADAAAGAVAAITDTVAVETAAGELGVAVTTAVEADAAAGAVVACLASVVCAVGVGVGAAAVAAIAAAAHVTRHSDGSLDVDPGQPGVNVDAFVMHPRNGKTYGPGAKQAICSQFAGDAQSDKQANNPNISITVRGDISQGYCELFESDNGGPEGDTGAGAAFTSATAVQCPSLDGGATIPAPFPDGSCPTPIPNHSTDPDAVQHAVGKAVPNSQTTADAVAESLAHGQIVPAAISATSGPATQTGTATTTVTTDPDGSTQTQTQTQVQQYTYTPTGIDVDTETQTQTTTKDANGNTTATTSSAASAPGQGTTSTSGNPDDKNPDLCALHPDIVACDTLGTPSTDTPQWSSKTVTFAPEDLGLPSGCPGPRTFTVRGIVFSLNYQPACDVAPMVAPALIAFCALGCALWIIGQAKG